MTQTGTARSTPANAAGGELGTGAALLDPNAAAWAELADLATRSGLPGDRVATLKRQAVAASRREAGRWLLVTGRPDAGIELLMGRWLSPAASDALRLAGPELALFRGKDDGGAGGDGGAGLALIESKLRPASVTAAGEPPAPVVALRAEGKVMADVAHRLATLGCADAAVLVMRLSSAFHQDERELARSLLPLAACLRVVLVALPSEEPSEQDVREVLSFAAARLRDCGWAGDRNGGVCVWYGDNLPRGASAADACKALGRVNPADEAAAAAVVASGVARLAREALARADAAPAAGAALSGDDLRAQRDELAGCLAALKAKADERLAQNPAMSDADLRAWVADEIFAWTGGTGASPGGIWLRYADRLKQGTARAIVEQAKAAASFLGKSGPGGSAAGAARRQADDSDEQIDSPRGAPARPGSSPLTTAALRVGVGLSAGLLVWGGLAVAARAMVVPGWVSSLTVLSLPLAAIGAYAAAGPLLRAPGEPRGAAPAGPVRKSTPRPPAPAAAITGWPQFEAKMLNWLEGHLSGDAKPLREQWEQFARRLGLGIG